MKINWLSWIPIVITALLMYWARVTNIGVTNYNIFLIMLIGWTLIMIVFFKATTKVPPETDEE